MKRLQRQGLFQESKKYRRSISCSKNRREALSKGAGTSDEYVFTANAAPVNHEQYYDNDDIMVFDNNDIQQPNVEEQQQPQQQETDQNDDGDDLAGIKDVESTDESDDDELSHDGSKNSEEDEREGGEEGEGDFDGGYLDDDGNPLTAEDYRLIIERLKCQDGFNFQEYVNKLQHIDIYNKMPKDFDKDFLAGISTFTKQEAAMIIHEYAKKCNLTASQVDELLALLKKLFPTANLPLRQSTRGNNLINEIDRYMSSDRDHMLIFDCCPCGKTVYAGGNRSLDRCPENDCQLYRYTPCKRCGSLGTCSHTNTERTAAKVLIYRPFVSVLDDLLRTPGFCSALDYVYMDYKRANYRDVSDGSEFQLHMDAMKTKYRDKVRTNDITEDTKEINIALSVSYDGTQLYKRRAVKFEPLVVTILNLPSSYFRSKAGAGMFLLGVSTSDGNAPFIVTSIRCLCLR